MCAVCLGACGAQPTSGCRRHTGAPGSAVLLHRPAAVQRRRFAVQRRPLQGTTRPVRTHCCASGASGGSTGVTDGRASGKRSCGNGGGPLWQTVLRHAGSAALVLGALAVSLCRPPLARARSGCHTAESHIRWLCEHCQRLRTQWGAPACCAGKITNCKDFSLCAPCLGVGKLAVLLCR